MLNDLDDFYYFAVVVEHGGFSAAERATDIPKSKLSRRVDQLEQHLKVRLIQRGSRHFAVTDIGMNVYQHAQMMTAAAQAAYDTVNHLTVEPRGVVRVSVPISIAQNELAHILPQFLKKYPEVRLQLIISNRRVDVIYENIDVAIRVRSKIDDDPSLIIRKFERDEEYFFASQAYLNQYGQINHPKDLSEHRVLSMVDDHTEQVLTVQNLSSDALLKVKINPTVMGSDLILLRELACQGGGVALLPNSITKEALALGQLVHVLPEWTVPHGILHAVYPSRRGMLPAVRVFINYLVEQLQPK
ncbi:LysR family transcriptional regulator [Acinetobacter apis]|uniref:DNA-binding transcriptional regulator, LysR family n=1 Tax=Acinetobacter apis TaxID=1229165 RepID=A0A217EDP2_9GAMM|nr:LysR family transcriptional regulator [Acinetobacter apis]SNQ28601.1 DNA-binding transcriptional regulator, LysR family [Acinetobacter apis]